MPRVMVLRHNPHEALGNLEVVFRACGLDLQVVNSFADEWQPIAREGFDPRRLAGLVVMGGPMNVDQVDRYPYLAAEVEWLRAATSAELPTLGVCLGAQLLAKALGQQVYTNRVKEIGWYEVTLTEAGGDDPLLAGSAPRETVFQWHSDTFDLPAGAIRLVEGNTCLNQAFRFGQRAWGLQFHLEMTAEMVEQWVAAPSMCAEVAAAPYIDPDQIRRRTPTALPNMWPLSERVFQRFARLCQGQPA